MSVMNGEGSAASFATAKSQIAQPGLVAETETPFC